jgi:hypothetical protein
VTAAVEPASLLERHGERTLLAARMTLSEFIVEQAERTTTEIGFGYDPQPEAPSTYAALKRAFSHSVRTGEPLPVSNANSEPVAYATTEVNFALRFVHDATHVRQRLSFALTDELELALWHLDQLEAAGFGSGSPVWQLLHADLLGSVYVMSLGRRFPSDQLRFASGCLSEGFDRTVLDEIRHARTRGQH